MSRESSLLTADPILFSPIHLNTDQVSTEKLLAFYRFANLFFPKMGSSLVGTMMDMERHAERLTANSSPAQRQRLIRDMEGMCMDMQCTLRDGAEKILEIAIHIVPSEVLERAQQGRNDLIEYQRLSDDLDKLIVKLITKEVGRRFTTKVGEYFKTFTLSQPVPSFISQLLEMGWINYKGQLLRGATIDDLLTGRYREQFEQLMPEELVQEGMEIRETIAACFEISQEQKDDADALIQDAKRRHALLEITIREIKKQ